MNAYDPRQTNDDPGQTTAARENNARSATKPTRRSAITREAGDQNVYLKAATRLLV
jgi:hypothetical protein